MKAESWFTAAEAVESGLADEISADAPKAKARWDLTAYANAPVEETVTNSAAEPQSAPENKIEQRPNIRADFLLRHTA